MGGCALAGAAARGLAGGGAGQLAGRARPRRAMAGAHRTWTRRAAKAALPGSLHQLATCGLHPDGPVLVQPRQRLRGRPERAAGARHAYPCACSRKASPWPTPPKAARAPPSCPIPAPASGAMAESARARRFNAHDVWSKVAQTPYQRAQKAASFLIANNTLHWQDHRLGAQQQDVPASVGDFVLRRADGLWAYQLAVVVDDAAQASPTSCAARIWPTTHRARCCCSTRWVCPRRTTCTPRWCAPPMALQAARRARHRPAPAIAGTVSRWRRAGPAILVTSRRYCAAAGPAMWVRATDASLQSAP